MKYDLKAEMKAIVLLSFRYFNTRPFFVLVEILVKPVRRSKDLTESCTSHPVLNREIICKESFADFKEARKIYQAE
ncbi:hypothetical protein ACROYT_G028114 [Oculina patagonica]